MAKIVKTPESQFENLVGYDFDGNYLEVEPGLNMHYLDEGSKNDPVVLLLHGEPSWSYLYRKMIPILTQNGLRAIAPDLIGFGKSDKWVDCDQYTYANHINWLRNCIESLELENIILFCQDWGGLTGLRLVVDMPDKFSKVIASNTALPTGQMPVPETFMKWREFSQESPDFDFGKIIDMGTVEALSEDVIAAYNAPFPSEEYKAGARMFPTLVPIKEDEPEAINNKNAWRALMQWTKPFITVFGDEDNIMKGADKIFQELIPGAKGQEHGMLHAGHFIQEEKGEELAEFIINFHKKTDN